METLYFLFNFGVLAPADQILCTYLRFVLSRSYQAAAAAAGLMAILVVSCRTQDVIPSK